jgi:hypothetical protein
VRPNLLNQNKPVSVARLLDLNLIDLELKFPRPLRIDEAESRQIAAIGIESREGKRILLPLRSCREPELRILCHDGSIQSEATIKAHQDRVKRYSFQNSLAPRRHDSLEPEKMEG